ncbi:hypothetical protein NHX12_015512, partial [Muraenolepis orangiensis]
MWEWSGLSADWSYQRAKRDERPARQQTKVTVERRRGYRSRRSPAEARSREIDAMIAGRESRSAASDRFSSIGQGREGKSTFSNRNVRIINGKEFDKKAPW